MKKEEQKQLLIKALKDLEESGINMVDITDQRELRRLIEEQE